MRIRVATLFAPVLMISLLFFAERAIASIDADGDGCVQEHEWMAWGLTYTICAPRGLEIAFIVYDANADGVLKGQEIINAIEHTRGCRRA